MNINQSVDVTISRDTATATGAAFGIPLILAPHCYWPERVASFASLDELASAGVPDYDPIYKAARAMLLQDPRPTAFKVGRQAATTIYVTIPDADVADATDYAVTLDGEEYEYTSGAYATA